MTLRKALLATAAVLGAVVLFLIATLPPAPLVIADTIPAVLKDRTVAGAFHVHSTLSDGTADRETIAAAAARAGLKFVVFADHGDGTRVTEVPVYRHGVLCVDGVEISTNGGHYVALDMRPSPYPLGGEAAAVVADVRRLGGFGIVAHPDSPKPELGWTDWSPLVDGLEWLNADSEWRDEPRTRLLRLPFDYLVRPGPALASILDRPDGILERWDALASDRPIVGLAGHDAHGGLAGRQDGAVGLPLPRVPSYEASFRSFSTRAVLAAALTGSAAADARMLLNAIRGGRVFTAIDAIAAPAWLDFHAASGDTVVAMGQTARFESGVMMRARAPLPDGARLALICNGQQIAENTNGELSVPVDAPGACRVEVTPVSAAGARVPWLVSNPIYILPAVVEPVGMEPLSEAALPLDHLDWMVEKDPSSGGAASVVQNGFRLEYQLGAGTPRSQYVAAAAALRPPLPEYERILFTASSAAPMRLSVQLRFAAGGGVRWTRSVFVSPDPRRVSVAIADLLPADAASEPVDFRNADSLLLVIDLTNARPGDSGHVEVTDLALTRAVPDR